MTIKIDFGLKRLEKIIEELDTQIQFLQQQKQQLITKKQELTLCEKMIN